MMFFVVVLRRQEYTINTTNALTYSTEFTTVHLGISIFIYLFIFWTVRTSLQTCTDKAQVMPFCTGASCQGGNMSTYNWSTHNATLYLT